MGSKIKSLKARTILNSRNREAVEAEIILTNGVLASASVPEGKSRGAYEAVSVEAEKAVKNIENIIFPALANRDVLNQKEIDNCLINLDGTENKSNLGANATLAVSIAAARAASIDLNIPLWKHIRYLDNFDAPEDYQLMPFINVINGGLHAKNNLDFQEYLVIARAPFLNQAVEAGILFYKNLHKVFAEKFGVNNIPFGDEGGFAPNFQDNAEPFEFMEQVSRDMESKTQFQFGLDAAASNINSDAEKLTGQYFDFKKRFDLAYIEDPYGENNFADFAALNAKAGDSIMIAGDDLTVTNLSRASRAKNENSVNAIIIKPNQIGTISEALLVARAARSWGWRVIASHRSGETKDDFIADFAYGIGADGIKIGAPLDEERLAKYNRLLKI